MTRAYTIQGREVGYDGVLSVGRVQTPVLGLVANRCEEIENFVSKPFYEVHAHLVTENDERFMAIWQPSEACEPYMDDMRRVLIKKLAEKVVSRISDKTGKVTKYDKKNRKQTQPLPFSLSALQIEAARQFGLSAQSVLSSCQTLYERHKLITYPRSDCRYLPKEHHKEATSILDSIKTNQAALAECVAGADKSIKSPAWNDNKVTAHHAIIPTQRHVSQASLSQSEQQVYTLIARQYVAQFYPPHEYADTRVEIVIEGGLFVATAKTILRKGWQVLFNTNKKKETEKYLPPLSMGQSLHCERGEVVTKNTTPPPYFTDATLLAAMTGISRFVTSAETRKILKDTDGLGTEATRAGIIELLFRRGFLIRKGKQIHATDAGRGLIKALPDETTLPDMTAHWESILNAISRREAAYSEFMNPLQIQLQKLIGNSGSGSLEALRGVTARGVKGKKSPGRKYAKRRTKKSAAKRKLAQESNKRT